MRRNILEAVRRMETTHDWAVEYSDSSSCWILTVRKVAYQVRREHSLFATTVATITAFSSILGEYSGA